MSQFEKPYNPEYTPKPMVMGVDLVCRIFGKHSLDNSYQLRVLADYVERRDTDDFKEAFEAIDVLMKKYNDHFRVAQELVVGEISARLDEDLPDLNEYLETRPGCLIVSDDKYHQLIEKSVIGVQKVQPTPESFPQMGFVTESEILINVFNPRCDVTKLSAAEQSLLSFYL